MWKYFKLYVNVFTSSHYLSIIKILKWINWPIMGFFLDTERPVESKTTNSILLDDFASF